jgi:hypothetical protein
LANRCPTSRASGARFRVSTVPGRRCDASNAQDGQWELTSGSRSSFSLPRWSRPRGLHRLTTRSEPQGVCTRPRGSDADWTLVDAESDHEMRRAIQVFGKPSSKQAVRRGFAGGSVADCAVTWSRIGLRVVFTTLGLNPGACNPDKQVWTATVTGKTWRTWRGLRAGDPRSRIRSLHPDATFRSGFGWVLATKYWPFGPSAPARVPTVSATVSSGRVATIRLYVDAQGE